LRKQENVMHLVVWAMDKLLTGILRLLLVFVRGLLL